MAVTPAEADAFVRRVLAAGPVARWPLHLAARTAGVPSRDLRAALDRVAVRSRSVADGYTARRWALPAGSPAPLETPEESPDTF